MKLPFRMRLHACIHPNTYKYFLSPLEVGPAWARCEARLGPIRRNAVLPIMEIHHPKILLRAPLSGNPVTVIRRRGVTAADVAELHELLGYEATSDEERPEET